MRRIGVMALAMVLVVAASVAAADSGPVIEHRPLRCVVALSYPWVQARATGAVALQARFRRADAKDWYTVRLSEEDDGWSGALPRPSASVASFVYVLEATGTSTASSRTEEQTVRVVRDDAACGSEGVGPSVPDATVVAEAPRGRPPLPKGFSPDSGEPVDEGSSRIGAFNLSPRTSLLAALGVGAAAATTVLLVSNDSGTPTYEIELVGSNPPAGSTISLTSVAVSVRLRINSQQDVDPGSVVIDFRPPSSVAGCVTLWAAHPGLRRDQSLDVTVDRVLFVTCTTPFTVTETQATLRGPGEADLFSTTLPLAYSFVP